MNPRGPGRPRILSRALIVTAARRIADEEGIEALTVRRVAQQLNTGQASLYRHIADRGELLHLLADDVAVHLPLPQDHPDVRTRIQSQWLAAYDYLADHLWAARIIAEGEHVVDSGRRFAESALRTLADAGLSPDDASRAYRALWHLLLGHLLNAHPVGHTLQDTAAPETAETAEGRRPGGEEVEPVAATHPTDASRADFGWALPRLLAGVLDSPAAG